MNFSAGMRRNDYRSETIIRKFLTRRKWVLGIVVAVIAASIGGPVYAHGIYEEGHTYTSTYNCTWSRAEISHGSGGGYSKASVVSKKNRGRLYTCKDRLDRPIKHLRAKWTLYKKNGSSWTYCLSSNYWYNGRTASKSENYRNHGSSPPCGIGEYMTKTEGGVLIGTWHGTPIESGVYGHNL